MAGARGSPQIVLRGRARSGERSGIRPLRQIEEMSNLFVGVANASFALPGFRNVFEIRDELGAGVTDGLEFLGDFSKAVPFMARKTTTEATRTMA